MLNFRKFLQSFFVNRLINLSMVAKINFMKQSPPALDQCVSTNELDVFNLNNGQLVNELRV